MWRRIILLSALACACKADHLTRASRHSVTITLSHASAAPVPNPYVSVVDSVAITVTPAVGQVIRGGARVDRRQSRLVLSLAVPEGMATIEAVVLSTNRSRLYIGSRSFDIVADGYLDSIPLTAQMPVMLVSPDTVVVSVKSPAYAQATLMLYNRGISNLQWTIRDTFAVSRLQCAQLRCMKLPVSFKDVAPGFMQVTIDSIRSLAQPIPLTFSSANGDVIVVVRTI